MNECDRSSNRLATVKLLLAHAQLLHKRYTGVLLCACTAASQAVHRCAAQHYQYLDTL